MEMLVLGNKCGVEAETQALMRCIWQAVHSDTYVVFTDTLDLDFQRFFEITFIIRIVLGETKKTIFFLFTGWLTVP